MIDDFRSGFKPRKRSTSQVEDFLPDLSTPPEKSPQPEPVLKTPKTPETQEMPVPRANDSQVDETIELDNTPDDMSASVPTGPKGPKQHWWHKVIAWFKGLDKKQKALVIAAVILAFGGLGTAVYALTKPTPEPPKPVVKSKPVPKPTTVPNTLTGRQVKPEINKRQVIGVMIENSQAARPQAGLQEAGVVFEAIAEGGITRFMTLYQDTEPASIGPIRSVRPYYLSWSMGFDAALAHVGGSPEALRNIKNWGTKDLDQFSSPGAYQRVTDRYAPHNMFSSYKALSSLTASKKYTSSTFTGFDRTTEKPKPAETPTARSVQVNISSHNYNSSYVYDKTSNTYARSMAGQAHKDARSGKQISPDVVVVMVMNYRIQGDGVHSEYNTVGSGKLFVFQNGAVTEGSWQKTSHDGPLTFRDGGGRALPLNPGQTWITAVSSADKVTYKP